MTAAAILPAREYVENGVTAAFAVPFRFNAPEHVRAARVGGDGVAVPLAYGTDYSVTGGDTDGGGTLTVAVPAPAGTRLHIRRVTPRAQITDYTENGTFPAQSHEDALDRAMLIDQEQDVVMDDVQARAMTVPDTVPSLPMRADRANKFLAFDSDGNPVMSSGTGADIGLREALAQSGGASMVRSNNGISMQDELNSLIDLSRVLPITRTAAGTPTQLDSSALNSTVIIDGVGGTVNMPNVATRGAALELIFSPPANGLYALQGAAGSGALVQARPGVEFIGGESATVFFDGVGWQLINWVRSPIKARIQGAHAIALPMGQWTDIAHAVAGTQLMVNDFSALWRPQVAGFFTAPRAMTALVNFKTWLDSWGGSGNIDVGFYVGTAALGSSAAPNFENFIRQYVHTDAGMGVVANIEIPLGAGITVFTTLRPVAGAVQLSNPHTWGLTSTVTVTELFQ